MAGDTLTKMVAVSKITISKVMTAYEKEEILLLTKFCKKKRKLSERGRRAFICVKKTNKITASKITKKKQII